MSVLDGVVDVIIAAAAVAVFQMTQFCTRDLFFSGLKERLMAEPLVTNINAIETAAVSWLDFPKEKEGKRKKKRNEEEGKSEQP